MKNESWANGEPTTELKEKLGSVVGSLVWIARCVRPGIMYRTARLQSRTKKPAYDDLEECNKVVSFTKDTHEMGLHYKSGLNWDEAALCS